MSNLIILLELSKRNLVEVVVRKILSVSEGPQKRKVGNELGLFRPEYCRRIWLYCFLLVDNKSAQISLQTKRFILFGGSETSDRNTSAANNNLVNLVWACILYPRTGIQGWNQSLNPSNFLAYVEPGAEWLG